MKTNINSLVSAAMKSAEDFDAKVAAVAAAITAKTRDGVAKTIRAAFPIGDAPATPEGTSAKDWRKGEVYRAWNAKRGRLDRIITAVLKIKGLQAETEVDPVKAFNRITKAAMELPRAKRMALFRDLAVSLGYEVA